MQDKFLLWKNYEYSKNKFGYYKDLVKGFRIYYSEQQVKNEYLKLLNWFKTDEVYRKYRLDYYIKYF